MKLLVVKLSDVGDLLTATPALRALRDRYPSAQIDVLAPARSMEVLSGLSSVDRLIPFEKSLYDSILGAVRPGALAAAVRLGLRLRRERYDCVVLLHHLVTAWGGAKYAALLLATGSPRRVGIDDGSGRGWFLTERAADAGFGAQHEVDYWLGVAVLLGAQASRPRLEVALNDADLAAGRRLLVEEHWPTVAIYPGSGAYSVARRWPAARFAAVADALAARLGARIVLVGSADEAGLGTSIAGSMAAPALDLIGQTTLKQLGAVLGRCDLLVGNDGGVMHLATAVDTRVVAVFGPSNPLAWGPYGYAEWDSHGQHAATKHLVVRAHVQRGPCASGPCMYNGRTAGNRRGCPARECLMGVTPPTVIAAAEWQLSAARLDEPRA
jgi:lipopolysaccharide heptosyltransferase II